MNDIDWASSPMHIKFPTSDGHEITNLNLFWATNHESTQGN